MSLVVVASSVLSWKCVCVCCVCICLCVSEAIPDKSIVDHEGDAFLTPFEAFTWPRRPRPKNSGTPVLVASRSSLGEVPSHRLTGLCHARAQHWPLVLTRSSEAGETSRCADNTRAREGAPSLSSYFDCGFRYSAKGHDEMGLAPLAWGARHPAGWTAYMPACTCLLLVT